MNNLKKTQARMQEIHHEISNEWIRLLVSIIVFSPYYYVSEKIYYWFKNE